MSRVRVHNFSVSLDGFGTGEGQSLEAPFGHAGSRLHEWFFPTRSFHEMQGEPGGGTGIDDALASNWGPGIGAEIMGRTSSDPRRGPWEDEEWKGWWGEDPPFHTPVLVLTHHPRPSIEMTGGTTFHFIDASPREALKVARESAGGLDVRIGGGPFDRPPVSRRRPDRPPPPSDRAHCPRTRRTPLGRAGATRATLQCGVGQLAERRHPSHIYPPINGRKVRRSKVLSRRPAFGDSVS